MSFYIYAAVSTLIAWFIGLVIDANITPDTLGITGLRIVFPILAMGLFIIKAIRDQKGR